LREEAELGAALGAGLTDLLSKQARLAAEAVLRGMGARDEQTYYTPEEAGLYLRCERQRIYDHVAAGRLPRSKEGGRLLFTRAQLDGLVEIIS
jgi:excisionase family DNA binding protein